MTIRIRTVLLGAVLMALVCLGYAADSGGTPLLPANASSSFKLGASAGPFARMSTVPVTGQPFPGALHIDVTIKPQRAADVQLTAPVDASMASGDVLLLSLWMRSATTGDATLDAGFRAIPTAAGTLGAGRGPGAPARPATAGAPGASGPFGASGTGRGRGPGGFLAQPVLNAAAQAGTTWKRIQFPFALTRAYNKGDVEIYFTLGLRQQTVEIGGIELVDFGTTKKVAELPFTKLGYPGSEPNARWRKTAEAQIEKIRKSDLTVLVKDKNGKPVRGAEVSVRMQKHAFPFGTAVSGAAFSGVRITPENLAIYKQHIPQLFNFSVMENETKWPQWANEASRPATITTIDWLRENGLQVRGHNLVWPSWNNTNVKAAQDARNDPAALAKVILDHIAETTAALSGRVVNWDVLNEPFTNHDFMDILGRHAMVDWFNAARAGDPKARLYVNDFSILSGEDKAHQDDYAATIQYLIGQGAPLDGIGLQSHFPARVTPIEEVLKRLDRFAAFGKDLEITEFDIDTADEATQADYTRDFMTVAFSNPSVKAFVMWGFWEGAHWRPNGAMFRRDWSLKPNGEVYKDLVFKQWWTNADGKTGAQGTYRTRGFLGDYEVNVKAGASSKTQHVSLAREGATVECVLD